MSLYHYLYPYPGKGHGQDQTFDVHVEPKGTGHWRIRVTNTETAETATYTAPLHLSSEAVVLTTASGQRVRGAGAWIDQSHWVHVHGHATVFAKPSLGTTDSSNADHASDDLLLATMPGVVTAIHVEVGQAVERGAPLMVLEAMKMAHPIVAPYAANVAQVHYACGDMVEAGARLVTLERQVCDQTKTTERAKTKDAPKTDSQP